MNIVEEGQLKGTFYGFKNRDTVFEFYNGRKWRQNEYHYSYHYAYRPDAKVVDEGGRYMLYVEGMSAAVEVRRV
ncbi:hypothetical protein [Ralstonia pseudosolanacearum]|uniref:hypothetical protein n=1 Tax=Ralstonia pseudosolanacearum TaxID=1310165 RepID=UPI0005C4BF16|nr:MULTISPECIES: hypothetical protein [Ralstonia]ANH33956.1 hypothetical protein A3768_2825 [Ralstonia solanacearum]OAI70909.1 hypothetical protein RSP781_04055 [Ralstonia pseudosolanacearum]UZF35883.1 hypothetical protein LGV81_04160 [Ralstonia sp. RS647]